jgi:biotin transporter BioY
MRNFVSGGWLALAALVATLVGSSRRDVPRKMKVMMWSAASLSGLASVYIVRVPNLMALVK